MPYSFTAVRRHKPGLPGDVPGQTSKAGIDPAFLLSCCLSLLPQAVKTSLDCLGGTYAGGLSDPLCQADLRTIVQRGFAQADATMSDEARAQWERAVAGPVWGRSDSNSGSGSVITGGGAETRNSSEDEAASSSSSSSGGGEQASPGGGKKVPGSWAEWLTRHKILAGPSGIIATGGLTCFFSPFSPMPIAVAGLVLAVLVSAPATSALPGLLLVLFLCEPVGRKVPFSWESLSCCG